MPLLKNASTHRFDASLPDFHAAQPKGLPEKRTVLLAEDHDDLRYVMECSLSAMGYRVLACSDAYVASTTFRSHDSIDVLVTDVEMPGRSGLELARELTGMCPGLPVMIITGSMLSDANIQDIEDRRWVHLSKPCHLPTVEAILQRMLDTATYAGM